MIEQEAPGGQAGSSSRIENYLGFPAGVSGDELSRRALQQARRLGAEILVTRSISGIDPAARSVHLDGGDELRGATIILATGVTWRHLAIPGIEPLIGKGIYYGAARSEAPSTHGLDVHIIGAGNSAGQAALFFASHARTVTIVCRGDALEKSMSQYLVEQVRRKPNISVELGAEVAGYTVTSKLEEIEISSRAGGEPPPRAAASSSSSAPTRTRPGCRRRSRSTGAATCSRAPTWPRTAAGPTSATRSSWRRACRASSRRATCASVLSNASPRPSETAAWQSPSCTSTCAAIREARTRSGGGHTRCVCSPAQARAAGPSIRRSSYANRDRLTTT